MSDCGLSAEFIDAVFPSPATRREGDVSPLAQGVAPLGHPGIPPESGFNAISDYLMLPSQMSAPVPDRPQ